RSIFNKTEINSTALLPAPLTLEDDKEREFHAKSLLVQQDRHSDGRRF
ncbi:arginine--tRNA ligase, partial [Haemophilus influenzae HK1212]